MRKSSNLSFKYALIALALIAGFAASAGAAKAAVPSRPFHYGLWSGGAYTNVQTGAFSHCAAGVPYVSGILLAVSVDRSFNWSLGFADPQWRLTVKTQIPIEMHFDGGPAVHVVGVVVFPSLVEVPMPDNSRLINTFRYSSQMSAQAQGQWFLFNLNGTSRIMVQLAECVRAELALETGQPPRSFAGPRTPVPPMNAPQDSALEETRLATNFLLAAQLPGAHLLQGSEIPDQLASYGAVWKAGDAVGTVKIYAPQTQLTGLQLASQIIAEDAQGCKGKFLSGRYSELVDNDVVVRAVTSCSESEKEMEAQYFITPRPNGGFVAFSISAATAAERQDLTNTQRLDGLKKAALIAVKQH
jgi:hypothetical protein